MTKDKSAQIGAITKEYGGFLKEFTKSDVFGITCIIISYHSVFKTFIFRIVEVNWKIPLILKLILPFMLF